MQTAAPFGAPPPVILTGVDAPEPPGAGMECRRTPRPQRTGAMTHALSPPHPEEPAGALRRRASRRKVGRRASWFETRLRRSSP